MMDSKMIFATGSQAAVNDFVIHDLNHCVIYFENYPSLRLGSKLPPSWARTPLLPKTAPALNKHLESRNDERQIIVDSEKCQGIGS